MKIVDYNKSMKVLIVILISLSTFSCTVLGVGYSSISGTLGGTVPVNAKVALFDSSPANIFVSDPFTPAADPDLIFQNQLAQTSGFFAPVPNTVQSVSTTYSMSFPSDPSSFRSIIAWNDLVADDIFDLATEPAYLPVKTINSENFILTHFTVMGSSDNLIYMANYSNLSYTINYNDHFDAIGNDGFNFTFD